MMDRRTVMAGLAAVPLSGPLWGTRPASAAGDCTEAVRGKALYSESVHTGAASMDGRYGINTRLCRYPEIGLAWIWVHAYTPDGFWAYTDHCAPCGPARTAVAGDEVRYAASKPALLSYMRSGPAADPRSASCSARVMARASREARHGPGDVTLDIESAFQPRLGFAGLLEGRTEIFGWSSVALTIGGQRISFEGPAQFHEQVQTEARFTIPFTYATLWGARTASTLVVSPEGSGGYILRGRGTDDVSLFERFAITPPAPERRLILTRPDGSTRELIAHRRQSYGIPALGEPWYGTMTTIDLDGEILYGNINDYIPGRMPYADNPAGKGG